MGRSTIFGYHRPKSTLHPTPPLSLGLYILHTRNTPFRALPILAKGRTNRIGLPQAGHIGLVSCVRGPRCQCAMVLVSFPLLGLVLSLRIIR
jgi:hypothetical protein